MNSKNIEKTTILFFDLDDTLVNTTKYHFDVREYVFKILIKNNFKTTIQKLWKIFWKIYKLEGANAQNHYDLILNEFNLEKNEFNKFKQLAIQSQHKFRDEKLRNYLNKNVINTLIKLKEQNIKLGIISSGIQIKQIEKLKLLKILNFFEKDLIFIQLKKDKKLYSKIFKQINKKYNITNIYMIGDREENDIIPAKKSKFKTIRFKGDGKYNFDFKKTIAEIKIEKIEELIQIQF